MILNIEASDGNVYRFLSLHDRFEVRVVKKVTHHPDEIVVDETNEPELRKALEILLKWKYYKD